MTAPATSHDPTPVQPSKAALWEDLIDIFYAPSQVYDRRRDGRFGHALVAAILLNVLLMVAFWGALQPIFEATVEMSLRQAAAKGQAMTPEQMQAARGFGSMMGGIMAVVGVPIAILGASFLTWVFGKLLDAGVTFAQAMAIVSLAQLPRVIGWLVIGAQALLGDNDKPVFSYMLGPSRFMDPETTSALALGLAARAELFTIWATILIAIGVAVIARVSKGKGAMVAGAVWLIASSMALLQAG